MSLSFSLAPLSLHLFFFNLSHHSSCSQTVVPQIQNCEGALSLWKRCIERARVYGTSVENFLKALAYNYTGQLPERSRAISDEGNKVVTEVWWPEGGRGGHFGNRLLPLCPSPSVLEAGRADPGAEAAPAWRWGGSRGSDHLPVLEVPGHRGSKFSTGAHR